MCSCVVLANPWLECFLDLIDAFPSTQQIREPTKEHGHTLDLVLCFGFRIDNLYIYDAGFSDHCPIAFDFILSYNKP